MAAGSSTVSVKEYSNGVKVVSIVFTTAASDTELTATTIRGIAGKELHSIVTIGGTTGPTINCDLSLKDDGTGNTDYVATNGANAVDSNNAVNFITPDTAYNPCVVWGNLIVNPDLNTENLVADASTTVKLLFKNNFN